MKKTIGFLALTLFLAATFISKAQTIPTPTVYFNSVGELNANFSTGQSSGLAGYSATGGIDNTGSFNLGSISASQVWTFHQSFAPTLSSWKISAFLNGTYITSMGVTNRINPLELAGFPVNDAFTGFRPSIAMGGGTAAGGTIGIFNQVDNSALNPIDLATGVGFSSSWKYWEMEVSYLGSNQYSVTVSIYSANSDGTISNPTPLVSEVQTVTNADLAASSEAYIFIGLNSIDITSMDNFYTSTYVPPATSWTGTTSSDWNTASNWSTNSVPTSTNNVVIPSAPINQPHVTLAPGTPAVCANLTVESGATLTVDAGKAITASGATANAGTILVKADATGIGSFIDNGTITGAGSFQMEQYVTGAGGATPNGLFWYVSSPVASATSNVYNAAGTDKLWSADESAQNYPEITDNATSLNVGQGYVARLGATGTKTFTGGAFNTGNQSASGLTRTGTTATNRGYNLVGNPYPSTVSWDDAVKTNLETSIYYRTNDGSFMLMDTYNATGSVGTNNNGNGAVTGDIPPTQAVWVRVDADGNTGQVDFTNAMRSHGTLSGIYRMASEEGTIRLTLSNGTVSDEQIVLFDPSAMDGYDDYDSQKYWSSNVPQLYTNVAEDTLTINGLSSPQTNPTVPLGMKLPAQGEYTLNATNITFTETNVYLEDTELNIFQDLNTDPVYAFTSNNGNIADRFVLHFGMSVTGVESAEAMNSRVYASNGQLNVILSENTKNGNVQVLDMAGRTVYTTSLNATRTTLDLNVNTGVYLVRVESTNGTNTHKIILN